jgi:shikimate kinase
MSMKFFLVGYMASGKSNIGRKLAHILKLDFIDFEEYIENKINQTIYHFYKTQGEEKYKEVEYESLKEIIETNDNFVLATSDITPCILDSMQLMKNKGTVIYLKIDSHILIERLKNTKKNRPQLSDIEDSELENFIKEQIKEREENCYNKASVIIDANVVSADQIATILKYQDKM